MVRFSAELPDDFPGADAALHMEHPNGVEYIYETVWVDHALTTTGQPIDIPHTQYSSVFDRLEDVPKDDRYICGSAPTIPFNLLTNEQIAAVNHAGRIQQQVEDEDPYRNTFAYMRQLAVDSNQLLYATPTEEGKLLQDTTTPFAAVAHAEPLGEVDFATAITGYYGFYRRDKADIPAFIPEELQGRANAYAEIDEPRIVSIPNKDPQYHIARLKLFHVETDLDFPFEDIKPKELVITVVD